MSPSRRPRRLPASIAALLAPLAFVVALSCPASAIMVGSSHDFVDNGYDGGVCDECHVPHYADATAGRLYPRPPTGATLPARLCMDCHDGVMPAGFPAVVPRALPSGHGGGTGSFQNCTVCHSHAQEFVVPNTDCLGGGGGIACHATIATAVAPLQQPFFGLTTASIGSTNLISQHNIRYQEDGNFATIETTSLNECKKCHPRGTSHPKNSAFLESPLGTIYPRVGTTGGYQAFCVACHDGVNAANPLNQFNGAVPAQQSSPSDPNTGTAPWRVPFVPRWIVGDCNTQAAAIRPTTPYFTSFYEVGGHGADRSMNTTVIMDVTCLSLTSFTAVGSGCHNAHSATNRMLIAEGAIGNTGQQSAEDFQSRVCVNSSCHDLGIMADRDLGEHQFHGGWSRGYNPSHTSQVTTGAMVVLQPSSEISMNITGVWGITTVLPFWVQPVTRLIEDRVYTKGTDRQVHCLTCHDPHGSASTRHNFRGEAVSPTSGNSCNTRAMLRKFPTSWDYADPFCSECHHQ